jgi:hypothetical protein
VKKASSTVAKRTMEKVGRTLAKLRTVEKAENTVEERRFSAVSIVTEDTGFSPGGRSLHQTLAATALLAIATVSAQAQKPPSASPNADLPSGAMQAKATTACTECHEARIILQQRLSKAAWTKEVDKMTKWGALVDAADRDALIDYLSANFSPDKSAYQPQRSSGEKAAK